MKWNQIKIGDKLKITDKRKNINVFPLVRKIYSWTVGYSDLYRNVDSNKKSYFEVHGINYYEKYVKIDKIFDKYREVVVIRKDGYNKVIIVISENFRNAMSIRPADLEPRMQRQLGLFS